MLKKTLEGTVITGRGMGKKFGLPTANIAVPKPQLNKHEDGIYAGYVKINGQLHYGAIHIGQAETVGDTNRTCEAHIIGFVGDLYGQTVTIQLIKKLRETEKFESTQKLVEAMKGDVKEVTELLS